MVSIISLISYSTICIIHRNTCFVSINVFILTKRHQSLVADSHCWGNGVFHPILPYIAADWVCLPTPRKNRHALLCMLFMTEYSFVPHRRLYRSDVWPYGTIPSSPQYARARGEKAIQAAEQQEGSWFLTKCPHPHWISYSWTYLAPLSTLFLCVLKQRPQFQ